MEVVLILGGTVNFLSVAKSDSLTERSVSEYTQIGGAVKLNDQSVVLLLQRFFNPRQRDDG